MKKEENSYCLRRSLHKTSLYVLKIIPILLAVLSFITIILDSFGFPLASTVINYIIFFIVYILLYLYSYVFDFCSYHRMFLHYIVITNIIKVFDYYHPLPLCDFKMLQLYSAITVISLFIILYKYVKNNKKTSIKNN